MTLPYEIVRAVLVAEVVAFIGLIAPLPSRWYKTLLTFRRKGLILWIGRSELFNRIRYFLTIIFVLVLILFLDSVMRSVKSASQHDSDSFKDANADTQLHAKMFYAQRNMYLTGFTLFLALVLSRFTKLLLEMLIQEEKVDAIKKQASRQSDEYARVIEQLEKKDEKIVQLQSLIDENEKKVKDAEILVKQTKGVQDEYMRLADRYNELEKKLRLQESSKDK